MIIDKTNPDHLKLFKEQKLLNALDGEILLEITKDSKGNTTGFHTATKQIAANYKSATIQERIDSGWDAHQTVLDSIDVADLPMPSPIQ